MEYFQIFKFNGTRMVVLVDLCVSRAILLYWMASLHAPKTDFKNAFVLNLRNRKRGICRGNRRDVDFF